MPWIDRKDADDVIARATDALKVLSLGAVKRANDTRVGELMVELRNKLAWIRSDEITIKRKHEVADQSLYQLLDRYRKQAEADAPHADTWLKAVDMVREMRVALGHAEESRFQYPRRTVAMLPAKHDNIRRTGDEQQIIDALHDISENGSPFYTIYPLPADVQDRDAFINKRAYACAEQSIGDTLRALMEGIVVSPRGADTPCARAEVAVRALIGILYGLSEDQGLDPDLKVALWSMLHSMEPELPEDLRLEWEEASYGGSEIEAREEHGSSDKTH